jgi:ribonuclease HI
VGILADITWPRAEGFELFAEPLQSRPFHERPGEGAGAMNSRHAAGGGEDRGSGGSEDPCDAPDAKRQRTEGPNRRNLLSRGARKKKAEQRREDVCRHPLKFGEGKFGFNRKKRDLPKYQVAWCRMMVLPIVTWLLSQMDVMCFGDNAAPPAEVRPEQGVRMPEDCGLRLYTAGRDLPANWHFDPAVPMPDSWWGASRPTLKRATSKIVAVAHDLMLPPEQRPPCTLLQHRLVAAAEEEALVASTPGGKIRPRRRLNGTGILTKPEYQQLAKQLALRSLAARQGNAGLKKLAAAEAKRVSDAACRREFKERLEEVGGDWKKTDGHAMVRDIVNGNAGPAQGAHSSRAKPPYPLLHDQKVRVGEAECADAFNEHFTGRLEQLPDERDRAVEAENTRVLESELSAAACRKFCVSQVEVDAYFRSLKEKKKGGADLTEASDLKAVPAAGRALYRALIESSVRERCLPEVWKWGVYCPAYKGGGKLKHLCESYRPLCLTSWVCKCAERIVIGRCVRALDGRFDPEVIGNTKNRGPEDNIATLIGDVEGAWAEGKVLVAAYVDLSQAFDRANHGHLVKAFLDMRADVPAGQRAEHLQCVDWLRSFLCGRAQVTRVGQQLSRPRKLLQGLPQGSVAGPMAWKVFIQGLVQRLRSAGAPHVGNFYDDLCLYEIAKTPETAAARLQGTLDAVHTWAEEHNMRISMQKTRYTVFEKPKRPAAGASRREADLTLNGEKVLPAKCWRYLGVQFDFQLTFQQQLEKAVGSFRHRLNAVRTLAAETWSPRATDIRVFYLGLCESVARYACGAWATRLAPEGVKKLEMLQEEGARLILGVTGRAQRLALLKEAKITPFGELIEQEAAVMWCKSWERARADAFQRAARSSHCTWARRGEEKAKKAGIRTPENAVPEYQAHLRGEISIREHLAPAGAEQAARVTLGSEAATAAEIAEEHKTSTAYYTDGAVTGYDGAAAWARYEKGVAPTAEDNFSCSAEFVLDCLADSFLAEQHALRSALSHALDSARAAVSRGDAPGRICVFTDSLSNVLSLNSPSCRDRVEEDLYMLINALAELGCTLKVQFVRGHEGTQGNEVADELATAANANSEAHRAQEENGGRTYPKTIMRAMLKTHTRRAATLGVERATAPQPGKDASYSAAHLREASGFRQNPLVTEPNKNPADRRDEIIFNQLRLDAVPFSAHYLQRNGAQAGNKCTCCDAVGDARHLLLECTNAGLGPEREAMWRDVERDRERQQREADEHATKRGQEAQKIRFRNDMSITQDHPQQVLKFINFMRGARPALAAANNEARAANKDDAHTSSGSACGAHQQQGAQQQAAEQQHAAQERAAPTPTMKDMRERVAESQQLGRGTEIPPHFKELGGIFVPLTSVSGNSTFLGTEQPPSLSPKTCAPAERGPQQQAARHHAAMREAGGKRNAMFAEIGAVRRIERAFLRRRAAGAAAAEKPERPTLEYLPSAQPAEGGLWHYAGELPRGGEGDPGQRETRHGEVYMFTIPPRGGCARFLEAWPRAAPECVQGYTDARFAAWSRANHVHEDSAATSSRHWPRVDVCEEAMRGESVVFCVCRDRCPRTGRVRGGHLGRSFAFVKA